MSNTEALRAALTSLLDHYTALVNSGDAGNWNPETEPPVIAARAALAQQPAASGEPVAFYKDPAAEPPYAQFARGVSEGFALGLREGKLQAANDAAPHPAPARVPPEWIPAHERVPPPGTECVVLLRYSLDRPPFVSVDKWDIQREDPIGMGGPTIETGEGWNDNFESDVIAWFPVPPHPPAEWDQRIAAAPGAPDAPSESNPQR